MLLYSGYGKNTNSTLFWKTSRNIWDDNGDIAYLYDDRGKFVSSYLSGTTDNTKKSIENNTTVVDTNNITVYVVPAITDNKILPNSSIPSSYISDTISVKASPGEFEPVSFVIHANQNINSMTVESTDLTGSNENIPSNNVDIQVVKCWYQSCNSYNLDRTVSRCLTPELLLKDESLIKVTGDSVSKADNSNPKGINYIKTTTGSYIDISKDDKKYSDYISIPISKHPIIDTNTLQPVTLQNGYNKQFWVTLNIPNNVNAGNYSGTITVLH